MAEETTTTLLGGRYAVLRGLDSGTAATVFLAEDLRLRRRVAIKRLRQDAPPQVASRFEAEAQVGASLDHPGLITIYDVATEDDGPLIVMEYVDGEPLGRVLSRGALEPRSALDVLGKLAAALDYVHSKGIVHCDVKPKNIILAATGAVKLGDLGLAADLDTTNLTSTGLAMGTLGYMSPERINGQKLGPQVDVYALAVVSFEVLTGHRVPTRLAELAGRPESTADKPLGIHADVINEPPPDIRRTWPGAPAAVAEVLLRGMAIEPGERQRSAGELARELARGLGAPSVPKRDPQNGPGSQTDGPTEVPAWRLVGSNLNDRGKALINKGRPQEAVPILRRAVATFPEQATDAAYAHALFNLGTALRQSGEAEEAIPILERRLAIPIRQDAVRRELELARADADRAGRS